MSRQRADFLPRDGEGEAHQQCARCVIPLVGHVHVPVHVETERERNRSPPSASAIRTTPRSWFIAFQFLLLPEHSFDRFKSACLPASQ